MSSTKQLLKMVEETQKRHSDLLENPHWRVIQKESLSRINAHEKRNSDLIGVSGLTKEAKQRARIMEPMNVIIEARKRHSDLMGLSGLADAAKERARLME